jgi:hypothetical protein
MCFPLNMTLSPAREKSPSVAACQFLPKLASGVGLFWNSRFYRFQSLSQRV